DKLEQGLDRPLLGARVLLVGITYKPDIADIRESAAVRVLEEAVRRGASVGYHDPLWPTLEAANGVFESISVDPLSVAGFDAVVLLTPHTSIDYASIVRAAQLVVDTHSGLHAREAPNVINVWVPGAARGAALLS